jgi:hypothetical protein
MTTFNQEDIEPLDFIVEKCLDTDFVITANPLIKKGYIKLTDEKGYGFINPGFEVSKIFVRYLHILDSYGVCKCNFDEDCESARSNSKTSHFQKQGGFKKMFADLVAESKLTVKKSQLEISNLELQKENLEYQKSIREKEQQIRKLTTDNLRLGNWDIRFRWSIAVITFLVGFIVKYFIDK